MEWVKMVIEYKSNRKTGATEQKKKIKEEIIMQTYVNFCCHPCVRKSSS